MGKLILMSAIFASLIFPVAMARQQSAKRGLILAIRGVLIWNVIYAALLILVYPKIAWR
jgi:hypothetical protein